MFDLNKSSQRRTKLLVDMTTEEEKSSEIIGSESEDFISELIMDVGQDMILMSHKAENPKVVTKSNDVSSTKCWDVSDMDSITLTDKINPVEKCIFEWEILNDNDFILNKENPGDISKFHRDEQLSNNSDWDLVSNVEDVISLNSSFGNNITSKKGLANHTYVDPVATSCTYCKIQSEETKSVSDAEEDLSLLYDSVCSIPRVRDDDDYRCKSIKLSFEELDDAYFERDCYKNTRGGKSTIMFKGNSPNFQWKRVPAWKKRQKTRCHLYKKKMEIRKWTQCNKQFDL